MPLPIHPRPEIKAENKTRSDAFAHSFTLACALCSCSTACGGTRSMY